MPVLDPVDVSFFDRAPQVVQHRAYVAAPRQRVFAAVAGDPAGWGRWFPGFSDDGRWETPPPYGVGSVRTVHAWHVRYQETIVAWDEDERWTFRVDETGAPRLAWAWCSGGPPPSWRRRREAPRGPTMTAAYASP